MRGSPARAGLLFAIVSATLLFAGLPGGGELWPLLFVALIPLFYVMRLESARQRFYFGLAAGFLHFALQLYWIVIVLGRYGGLPWFFAYPAFLLLVFYMALYTGCFTVIAGYGLDRLNGVVFLWFVPVLWVGLDWLRSVLFSGFPWMDLGYGLWQVPLLIQTADIFGHHAITFVLLLVNCLLFLLLQRRYRGKPIRHIGPVVIIVAAMIVYGYNRTNNLETTAAVAPQATIGIVQGNIDQSKKWSPDEQQRTIDIYLQQSEKILQTQPVPQLIVWPETALPFFPSRSSLFARLQQFSRDNSVSLLTGSPWFEVVDVQKRDVDFYNSAFILDHEGAYGDMYFKSHLVPFGEYVPMKKLLPFLAPLVEAVGDFSPGEISNPLTAAEIRGGVLICFESIFPDIARKWVANGANVLINLTNDAWYGRSSAPSQSLAMSVFRAVETRRSLVRSANTGISAYIDPLGRINAASDIFVVWSASMQVSLLEMKTVHSRFGYLFAPFCFFLSLVVSVLLVIRMGKNSL